MFILPELSRSIRTLGFTAGELRIGACDGENAWADPAKERPSTRPAVRLSVLFHLSLVFIVFSWA